MSDPVPNGVPERRAAVRYLFQHDSTCNVQEHEESHSWEARIKDISRTGIGLFSPHPFAVGRLLCVEVQDGRGVIRTRLRARVAHAYQTNGGWAVGCALMEPLPEPELQALLK